MNQNLVLLLIGLVAVALVILGYRMWKHRSQTTGVATNGDANASNQKNDNGLIQMKTHKEKDERIVAQSGRSPQSWVFRVLSGVVIIAVLSTALWYLPKLFSSLFFPDQFVVVVTPFQDGGNGQTGNLVAQELVDVLQQQAGQEIHITFDERRPSNAQNAQAIAAEYTADALLWGSVRQGELLDSPSLQPQLLYVPNGSYGPNAWLDYAGRFALPQHFALSNAPVNGKAVLPRLLLTLARYGNGQGDRAYEESGNLLAEQQALNMPLLWMVRGNVEWAQARYDEAIATYQYGLELVDDERTRGLLANNLGAILLDAGNVAAASQELAQARERLGDAIPPQLLFNEGLLHMYRGNYAEAVHSLQQAREGFTEDLPQAPVLLTLSHAHRQLGQLQSAEQVLEEIDRHEYADSRLVPPEQRGIVQNAYHTALLEQRGLLHLAQAVDARGPVAWELEIAPPGNDADIAAAIDELSKAVVATEKMMTEWNTRDTAEEAQRHFTRGQPEGAAVLIADGQVERLEFQKERQNYELALGLIEQGRRHRDASGFFAELAKLFGSESPFAQAERLLTTIIESPWQAPSLSRTYPAMIAHARLLRYRGLNEAAAQRYQQAQELAAQQPESYFGQGELALLAADRGRARQLMEQALGLNDAYFPARVRLVDIAVLEQNWDLAAQHMRVLAEQYPQTRTQLRLASVLRRGANYAEAEQMLQPLIDRGEAEALIERGRVRRDMGNMEAAIQDFSQAYAMKQDPSASGAAFEWGQTLLIQGNPQAAEQKFLDAIRQNAENTMARLALVNLYLGPLNNPTAADRQYSTLLEAGIHDADLLIRLGNALLDHEEATHDKEYAERAANAFRQAIAIRPGDPQVHHRLAQAYLHLNNPSAALREEQEVLNLTSQSGASAMVLRADALVGMGNAELLRYNADQAETYYNDALALNPDHVGALIGLGRVATARENWAVAQGYFEAAINRGGQSNPLALFWLAEAQLRQPDPQAAIATYKQVLELDPNFHEAILGRAQAEYALDESNPTAALQKTDEVLAMNQEYGEAWLFKCKVLHEHGRIENALDACDKAIAANGRLADAYYQRGTIYIQQEEYGQAVRDLKRSVALRPDAEALYWLGRAYFTQNNMPQAVAVFNRAETMRGGNYPDATFYGALAEQRMGRYESAIADLETLARSAASNEWVERAQAELERLREAQPVQLDVQISGNAYPEP
jgi:tetratricopeptide (TPR) repeat protein